MTQAAFAMEQYRKAEIETVGKLDLLVMLFDGAIRFLREAKVAISGRKIREKAEKLDRVLAIISELRGSLNHQAGGEFAMRMDALYAYMSQLVLEASHRLDPAPLDQVITLIQPIRDAWAELAKSQAQTEEPPVTVPEPVHTFSPPAPPVYQAQPAENRPPLELFG